MPSDAREGPTEPPTALVVPPAAGQSSAGPGSPATIEVDAAAVLRPVTRVAAGGLYAVTEFGPPVTTLLPLRLNTVTQPPPGVQQKPNGQPAAGDGLLVAAVLDRVGAKEYLRLPDIYPDFPYQWVSWDDWSAKVDEMVDARLAARATDDTVAGYELWNEPDLTWDTARAGDFETGWVRTFRQVRAKDPLTPIVGPSLNRMIDDYMRSFLAVAKAHDALPEVMCWHELHGPHHVADAVVRYRQIERDLDISPRPISINEYGAPDEIDVAGKSVSYIAKFERAGVRDAHRAFWYEYGTVNGLVDGAGQPTASYHLYRWYAELAGSMLPTTPPAPTGLDGFAALDSTRGRLDVVLGDHTGAAVVTLRGIGSLGPQVSVRIETTPASGRTTPVAAPTLVAEHTLRVEDGSLDVPLADMASGAAYRLSVGPSTLGLTENVFIPI